MSLTNTQLRRCVLLGFQLLKYFSNEDNPHKDLLIEVEADIRRITHEYNSPGLPRHNPFLLDWPLEKRELAKAIAEFRKLAASCRSSSESSVIYQRGAASRRQAARLARTTSSDFNGTRASSWLIKA